MSSLAQLNRQIIACTLCPRLIAHCQKIAREKKRAYREWDYWGKPVPGFGDPKARVLILGLAPGAHGSNRTGRPFTGDGSGNFLYRVLHRSGFASQPDATDRNDGLTLRDCYITAVARCAPPGNKPTPQELTNCSHFLDAELALLKSVRVIVALGRIAFDGYLSHLIRRGFAIRKSAYAFSHGGEFETPDGRILLCAYHPSLQNTNTGKLTEAMLLAVFRRAKRITNH